MNAERLEQILAAITPARLRETILSLAERQAPDNRTGVGIGAIIAAVTGGEDLGSGVEGWQAYERIKRAITETVGAIVDMRYVTSSP